jgi:hypothetical protein
MGCMGLYGCLTAHYGAEGTLCGRVVIATERAIVVVAVFCAVSYVGNVVRAVVNKLGIAVGRGDIGAIAKAMNCA